MIMMKFASFLPPAITFEDLNVNPKNCIGVECLTQSVRLFDVSGKFGDSSITIDAATYFKPRTKYIVLYSPLKGLLIFDHNWLFKSKSNWPGLKDSHYVQDVVANIYFHDTPEDFLVFTNFQPICQGIEFVHPTQSPVRVHDYMMSLLPSGEDTLGYNTNLRIETFTPLSDIDSIVALEQQVDLLTRLVKCLLENQAPPSWADAFLNGALNNAVDTVRPVDSVIDDMNNHKQAVREAQAAYLNGRK